METCRIEAPAALVRSAANVLEPLGISVQDAVDAYLRRIVWEKGIPFQRLKMPSVPAWDEAEMLEMNSGYLHCQGRSDRSYHAYLSFQKE